MTQRKELELNMGDLCVSEGLPLRVTENAVHYCHIEFMLKGRLECKYRKETPVDDLYSPNYKCTYGLKPLD